MAFLTYGTSASESDSRRGVYQARAQSTVYKSIPPKDEVDGSAYPAAVATATKSPSGTLRKSAVVKYTEQTPQAQPEAGAEEETTAVSTAKPTRHGTSTVTDQKAC